MIKLEPVFIITPITQYKISDLKIDETIYEKPDDKTLIEYNPDDDKCTITLFSVKKENPLKINEELDGNFLYGEQVFEEDFVCYGIIKDLDKKLSVLSNTATLRTYINKNEWKKFPSIYLYNTNLLKKYLEFEIGNIEILVPFDYYIVSLEVWENNLFHKIDKYGYIVK